MMANIWWSLPLTLIVFFAARKLAARYKFPLLNPLLVAMVVIIPFLMLTGISYDSYFKGSEVLNDLLQPAVVALAYPLYEQLHQIDPRPRNLTPPHGRRSLPAIVGTDLTTARAPAYQMVSGWRFVAQGKCDERLLPAAVDPPRGQTR